MKRKKHQKPKLSEKAQARIEISGAMIAAMLERGFIPELIIGVKEICAGYLDYVIVPHPGMTTEQVEYVLRRVLGKLDGSIDRQVEEN